MLRGKGEVWKDLIGFDNLLGLGVENLLAE